MRLSHLLSAFLLLICTAFFGYYISISEGYHGGGDSLGHFRIAKFSLEHPEWLLDHWGKPFFTLLAFPFAQLGFKGIQFFNLLLGVLTSLIAIGICNKNKWENGWLVIPVIMFTPVFMQQFFSGLTEAAFAMLVLLSVWFKLKKRYVISMILLSFSPMIRTEAVLFLAWFGLLELVQKRYKSLPFLFTGTLLYSVIGWVAKDDFLWLINEIPYGGDNIYGSGALLHYLHLMPWTIGWVLIGTSVIGIILALVGLIKQSKSSVWLITHIIIPALLYLVFHSIMWYLGKVSAGLPRMLAVLVPFMAVGAVYTIQQIDNDVKMKLVSRSLALMLAVLITWNGVSSVTLPVELGKEEKILQKAADYIRANELDKYKIHYYSLFNEVTLGLDPHHEEQCQQVIHKRSTPHINVKANSLVIYDTHFAPNEGQMPLENLTSSPYFELVETFRPEEPFTTLGNQPFEVYLFFRKDTILP